MRCRRERSVLPQSATNANTPGEFDFWVNDFQVHALSTIGPGGNVNNGDGGIWPRMIARAYGYTAGVGDTVVGGTDNGVWPMPMLNLLFDRVDNFAPANQYLATDATTKLQIRGSTWGSGANFLEVLTRMLRPVSGEALFA